MPDKKIVMSDKQIEIALISYLHSVGRDVSIDAKFEWATRMDDSVSGVTIISKDTQSIASEDS